jgi:glycosyltransferase involved in cell wall biosynthesis
MNRIGLDVNTPMKVLWLSNCQLKESDIASTGTWIQSMAEGLLNTGSIELAVISVGNVPKFTRQDYREVLQWIAPVSERLGNDGLPSDGIVKDIVNAINQFKPDLIHVWGVELFWGLLISRKYTHIPSLLEMQGMKSVCAKYYTADLTVKEIFQCVGIKEVLKRKVMISNKNDFLKSKRYEDEILCGHCYIDVQSEWMLAQVNSVQPSAKKYFVDLALRNSFYSARPWLDFEKNRNMKGTLHNIYISSSGGLPYKGIHVAIRALAELKKNYPNARLRIAGKIQKKGLSQDGYVLWLNLLSRKLNVFGSIDWLGPLNADQIIEELQYCGVNIVCSFVESYCLALAEPMYLGVPCVTSFTGGTSWIGKDNENVLFYTAGDAVMCAHKIDLIFSEPELRHGLSTTARKEGLKRHDLDRIAQDQLVIYKKVIGDVLE